MDPRLRMLESALAAHRDELAAALDSAPEAIRATSPAEGRWSVDRVLEHLALTEGGIVRLLSGLIPKAGTRAPEASFEAAEFERHVAQPWILDRGNAVRGSQPPGQMDAGGAWDALQNSRAELLRVIEPGAGRRLEDVTYAHPTGRELDLYQWIAFVGLHEARHAAQIREILVELEARRG